jgi:hypothetical protein
VEAGLPGPVIRLTPKARDTFDERQAKVENFVPNFL